MKIRKRQTFAAFLLFLLTPILLTAWLTSNSTSAGEPLFNQFPQPESDDQSLTLGSNQGFAKGKWLEIGHHSATDGGVSNNNGRSFHPSLAIGTDDLPIVAWADESGGNWQIYARRWNGSEWSELGVGSAQGGGISATDTYSDEPSLAVTPSGRPVIAWRESITDNSEIYARRWNGAEWAEMGPGSASGGGISNTSSQSYNPSLAIGPDGLPVVAWEEYATDQGAQIYVRRWNGTNWEEIGASSASGPGISATTDYSVSPSLAVSSGNIPFIAWREVQVPSEFSKIYVRRWNGSAWVEVGAGSASGDGLSSGWTLHPSLAIAPDGFPLAAWQHSDAIHALRWNGTTWAEIGAGSASGSGISPPVFGPEEPSLAVGSDGHPIVAWQAGETGRAEIFVRHFDGKTWNDMGLDYAQWRGISGTGEDSTQPAIAIGLDGRPIVAWREATNQPYDNVEVYVRRWQPAPVADFIASPTAGLLPLTVAFTNLSSGDFTDCLWDFGDGRTADTCDNPSIQFTQPGGYTISLTVTGPGGADTLIKTDYIRAGYTTYLPSLFSAEENRFSHDI